MSERAVSTLRNEVNEIVSELSLSMTMASDFEELLKEMATQLGVQPSDIKIVAEGDDDPYVGCIDPDTGDMKPAIEVLKSSAASRQGTSGFDATEEAKKEAERMNRELGVE